MLFRMICFILETMIDYILARIRNIFYNYKPTAQGRGVAFALAALCCALGASGYSLRRIGNEAGLSNSSVLSMSHDGNGVVWVGTCDGVNLFDGRSVSQFRSLAQERPLSGELISVIYTTPKGDRWFSTGSSLHCLRAGETQLMSFGQFHELRLMSANSRGDMFVVDRDRTIKYLPIGGKEFRQLGTRPVDADWVSGIYAGTNRLLLFTNKGIQSISLTLRGDTYSAGKPVRLAAPDVDGCYVHGDEIFYITLDQKLMEFHPSTSKSTPVGDFSRLRAVRGSASDVVRGPGGSIFVAFILNGVVKLHPTPSELGSGATVAEPLLEGDDIGVRGGVFCLAADRNHPVLWVGSDGQGLLVYAEDDFSTRSLSYSDLGDMISRPIRAIYFGNDSTLWLGTKGDGLLRIPRFSPWNRTARIGGQQLFTRENSDLNHNSVYALTPDLRHGGVWVGSDGGINYIAGDRPRKVQANFNADYVHAIVQRGDTLWIAGRGVFKALVAGSYPDGIVLQKLAEMTLPGGDEANFFFALHMTSTGTVYAAHRGRGLFRIDGDRLTPMPLADGAAYPRTASDLFSIAGTDSQLWLGTGAGLLCREGGKETSWSERQGFPMSAVHTLLGDSDGNIWVTTNHGLVRVDATTGGFKVYGHSNGLNVTEFSDGAAFRSGGTLFFGGIDGIAMVSRNAASRPSAVLRPLLLTGLNVAGSDVATASYLTSSPLSGEESLSLGSSENTFTIRFAVPDHINPEGYTYLYSLNGGRTWQETPTPGTISFTSMAHGDYTLTLKAANTLTGEVTPLKTIKIHIDAPWYLSWWAISFYALLAMGAAWLWLRSRRNAQLKEQREIIERVKHEQKEKTYEEKLRFFTNITHEFCTPLTLIYGPCERILSYGDADSYVRRYASLIKSNTERLNALIQEVIDFRRVETGHQKVTIRPIDISGLCTDILTSFYELQEQRGVRLESCVQPDLTWPTDYNCFTKIVYNLVSNAFKYTPTGGVIKVDVREEGSQLRVSVYNTGAGISPDDRQRIFNRYSILDNVEENATRGLSSRNGLGMAICHSMTELLGGSIAIESTVGEYAEFIVTLPQRELSAEPKAHAPSAPQKANLLPSPSSATAEDAPRLPASGASSSSALSAASAGIDRVEGDSPRSSAPSPVAPVPLSRARGKRIMVVDDNPDILSLLSESLDEYEVVTASNGADAMAKIKQSLPELILTDLMMPGIDGLQLVKNLRADRHLSHVPLVILSARTAIEDRVEGLQSGADAYVTKPFTMSYLRAVIERLLKGKTELREYYNTSAAAYEYTQGKLMEGEDSRFVEALDAYIDENLDNADLSPETLAAHMQMSTRKLYRKMKELELLPPNDYIKNHRISFAARLLVTTSLTVQEILYRCGFSNRSHFYKEFDRRFGTTPKDYRLQNRPD